MFIFQSSSFNLKYSGEGETTNSLRKNAREELKKRNWVGLTNGLME